MSVTIKQVRSKKEFSDFIWFGINMYKDNPYAAPPLYMDDSLNLKKGSNPALDFCDTVFYLAYKDGRLAGRIAGIINPRANEAWNQKYARFGWVDFTDDAEVTDALFEAVEKWAREKGMEHLHGPMGFTDFDHEGMLIEGFDRLSTLATIYNFPYYPEHMVRMGYDKDIDFKEYLIKIPDVYPERYVRMSEIVKGKYGLEAKKFKSRKEVVNNYALKIFDLLNLCYKDLYGFVKLTEAQVNFYIKLFFNFFRLDTICIVTDKEDNVVAFGIGMPSFTRALQKAKGSLFPFGWYHMLQALRKNDLIDLYLMAVHPDYQNKGVNAILFAEIMPAAIKNGYKYAETNPELETNLKMSSQWGSFEHENHKRRRVFIKKLA